MKTEVIEYLQFTPAPWRMTDRSEVSDIKSADSTMPFAIEKAVEPSAVMPIADICNFPPATEEQTNIQRANAVLIAAAPELHDELVGSTFVLEGIVRNMLDGVYKRPDQLLYRLESIISSHKKAIQKSLIAKK